MWGSLRLAPIMMFNTDKVNINGGPEQHAQVLGRGHSQVVINMRPHCPCAQQHNVVILFFFLFLSLQLRLVPLLRVVHDVISAGQDGGFTLLTLPLCPTHETGLGYGAEGPVQHFRHTTQGSPLRSMNGVIDDSRRTPR